MLILTKQDAPASKIARTAVLDRGPAAAGRPQKTAVVSMELAGASRQEHVTGAGQLPGTANYFIGNDPSKWHTGVPTYARVRYSVIYFGVDLVYYGNQRRLEYDFVVAPGVDPKSIRMRLSRANGLRLGGDGNLVMATAGGALEFHKPEVHQVLEGQRTAVGGSFTLLGKRTVGFRLTSYDHTKALVIDPVLSYSTFLGGSDGDRANAIAVDAAGNVYLAGTAASSNFPVTSGAYQTTNRAAADNSWTVFVTKLNPSGSALIYSAYLGGSGNYYGNWDHAYGLAVDASRNAYIAGSAGSGSFPVTQGIPDNQPDCGVWKCCWQRVRDEDEAERGHAGRNDDEVERERKSGGYGRRGDFSASVAATTGSTISTGRVDFSVDGTASVTSTLDGAGSATWTTSSLTAGKHTVEASYESNTTFAPSNNSLSETITAPTDPSSVTVTGGPVVAGGKVVLTATVSGSGPTAPTGTVTFATGTASLGVATLVSGVATLANVSATETNGLGVGEDEVAASYVGDATFLSSVGSFDLLVYSPELPMSLSLSSNGTIAGGADFPLTVNGANLSPNSVLLWNGAVRATTYVSGTELAAVILAADIAQEGTNLVTVANFAPNPGASSALPFAVMSSTPVATISGGSIVDTADGGGIYMLSLLGADFVSNSTVEWNGAALATTYASPWQITAVIPAPAYALLPVPVTVLNPAGSSAAFQLKTAVPITVTISPVSALLQVGASQQFTATVTGTLKTGVLWSVNVAPGMPFSPRWGTISTSGLYTAPATVPTPNPVKVIATSAADPSETSTALVTIASAVYNLTLSTTGTGGGTVTPNPVGISFGSNCYSYASGTVVQLTTGANAGSTFAGWGGAYSGTGACSVTMNSSKTVSAIFTLVPIYNLTLSTTGSGGGTITPKPVGTSCGTNCYSYLSGTVVQVAASASAGSTFAGWGGACSGTGACSVIMSSTQFVSAAFTQTPVYSNLTLSTTNGAACSRQLL